MWKAFVLFVFLGLAQRTLGQFDLSLVDYLLDIDESSGDETYVTTTPDLINDTPSPRCGRSRFGYNCLYPQLSFSPAVPKDQWKDKMPNGQRMCSVFGTSYVMTLDRAVAMHSGTCEVRMAAICDDPESPSVWVTRSKENGYISRVRVDLGGEAKKIILTDLVYDGDIDITGNLPTQLGSVEISRKYKDYISVKYADIEVLYSFERSVVRLLLPNELPGELCGLCGNMDGDKANDVTEFLEPSLVDLADKSCRDPTPSVEQNPDMERCMKLESTHKMCNLLISEAFTYCMKVANPAPFFEFCLHDVCKGDVLSRGDLLCNITAEYASQCDLSNGMPREWRSLANCVIPCSSGFVWSECTDFGRTCAAQDVDQPDYFATVCNAGCQCEEGTYLQGGVCVTIEECKCTMDGKLFEPGEIVTRPCENTCTCHDGHWDCTENTKCSGVARASGAFHFTTFDGRCFEHKDSCTHILAKDCGGNEFIVLVSYEEHYGTFYKYTTVAVKEGEKIHKFTLQRDGKIDHNGRIVSPPLQTALVDIQRIKNSMILKIIGKNIQVIYDMQTSIVVHVPTSYMGKMCGLGGNFNGQKSDDYRLKSKYIAENAATFASDWKWDKQCLGAIPDIATPDDCDSRAKQICSELYFYPDCSNFYDAARMCREDVCSLTSADAQTVYACSNARSFLTGCFLLDRDDFYNALELGDECVQECPEGTEYRESSYCSDSCASLSSVCTGEVYASCFCPSGTYSNSDGSCVPREECHCHQDGVWYEPGKVTSIPNMDCSCSAGVMTCTKINETLSCPSPNMVYHSCADPYDIQGAACEPTCEDLDEFFCMAGACMTGCACKSGLYRTPEGTCVPREQCGCFAGSKYYKHGESYMDDCNTVTCSGGVFITTDLVCPRTCWVVGASHYRSFDGLRYDFEGDCEYVLASDYCPNNRNGGLFSVHTKNTLCGSSGMTCSKSLIISVKSQKITLERGREPTISVIEGTRFRRAITGFTDHSRPETFTIKQKGIFTVVDTCIGMTVMWDGGTRIYIRLTEEFAGTTCGLCGNFDGSDENDYILANGLASKDVFQFGNSWKFPPQTTTCLDSTIGRQINASCTDFARKEWSIEKCRVISDPHGAFAACHATVDPKDYFDMCVYDACGCDGGGDCECLCTAIAHYAHTCANRGVPIEWRSNSLCPIMCEQYNDNEDVCLWHYRPCATCITDTCCDCQQPVDTHWCVEGCFPKCPEGYILDEMTQKCILLTDRDAKCTWFSSENMCHTCEKCEVCKTPSGAVLRVKPGEKRYFPVGIDACEIEWCAMDTTGDLCYNGTIEMDDCKEFPIPKYDPRYYTQTCWNSTESECKSCRECKQDCIIRNDSCEAGRKAGEKPWRVVYPILPTPERGAKTYCVEYRCENHTEATDPQCDIQKEERVVCKQSIDDVICEEHEVLKIYPTGDDCCPEEYECVCEVCKYQHDGIVEYMKSIQPGETQEWCKDEDTSNCCFTDKCTEREPEMDKRICPVMTRIQAPCTTGPAPTCSPGFIWKNLTRSEDCCPWGECECDACYDYDSFNNRVLKLVGDVWNKKCMKFKCVRGVRATSGCYETKNIENITCAQKPICKSDEHVEVVGIDEWECCDIYDCVCNDQCHVTVSGSERVLEVGVSFMMDDGCWYECVDPRTSGKEDCPRPEKKCYPPEDCKECEFIANTVNDTCGCDMYECQTVERCPTIECPPPYDIVPAPSGDKCKEPCWDCECTKCLDEYQNKIYKIGNIWERQLIEPASCLTCECMDKIDSATGCPTQKCEPKPCEPVEECESPYDTAIHSTNECGCTILVGCVCPHCVFNGKVVEGKNPGDRWTVGDVERGCYDTYECLGYKTPGEDKECFNVTKLRNPCPIFDECPEDFVAQKDSVASCDYDDGEHCPHFNCTCVKCRFDGKSYVPGEEWTKDCIDYVCTDEQDTADPARCKKITSTVVECPVLALDCHGCYVERLQQERQIPDFCCNEWGCEPELFCLDENNERVDNGTIWNPEPCKRVQCAVSPEDWDNGICPTVEQIDHCDPDPTVCTECQNRTIVKDECGCDKVECPPNNTPTSCNKPAENQIIEYFNTGDSCYTSKNCCVCDDACYYNGVRKDLFSVWWDKSSCTRLRCVPPESTLTLLGFEPKDIYFEEDDAVTWSQIITKLNYRKMLSDIGIARSLYSECSQDISLCPVSYDIGCPKPAECGECEHTEETVDTCGCPVLKCTPYECPPAPWDVKVCPETKPVLHNISLQGLTEFYPCCKEGRECICREGCLDQDGNLRAVGEVWDEKEENKRRKREECERSLIKMTCIDPKKLPEPVDACPEVKVVPCETPVTCGNCENRTSYFDDYCCEIASCKPLNDPIQCIEPGVNQRISNLETGDECFPSRDCCVCDTTCTYKGATKQLFEVWEDPETCTRMRCVLPETTIRALGYDGKIKYEDLDGPMQSEFESLKASIDYRRMMLRSEIAPNLYELCQQEISLCPTAFDIGCKPDITCNECEIATTTKDSCNCNVTTCTIIERCPSYIECPSPYRQKKIEDADKCKAPCYECVCDHVCLDNFDNRTYAAGLTWNQTHREPIRQCKTCTCTTEVDEKDGCLIEQCTPIACPTVAECEAPFNKAIYGEDDCGCTVLIDCECTQCIYNGEVLVDRTKGETWTDGDVDRGCYDTYYCDPIKDVGKTLECYNVTATRQECTVDPPCEEGYVAVPNDLSCCFDDENCCPRHSCVCVKCRFDGKWYNPGDTWTKDCVDYTCTNSNDTSDECPPVTNVESPCEDIRPECTDCYVEYLEVERNVPDECCNKWGCKAQNVCIKDDGERVPNGTVWDPAPCKRVMCFVSGEDWAMGTCPVWKPIDHCDEDTRVCAECTNKTIVKDECGCDKIECPPVDPPIQCTEPKLGQVIEFFNNDDTCSAGKNCCVCDTGCYDQGKKYELFSVWWNTCERKRCVLPDETLSAIHIDPSTVKHDDLYDFKTQREVQSALNYGQLLRATGIHNRVYDQCYQNELLCPVARNIGCPPVEKCPPCKDTVESVDECGCPVVTCTPYVCPPDGFVETECTEPKSFLANVTLFERSDRYPCCTWGWECQCQKGCKDSNGTLREIGEEWDEFGTNECGKTLTRTTCIPAPEGTNEGCPVTVEVQCETPVTCEKCENRTSYIDEYCCEIGSCKPLNDPVECTEPAENQRISTLETGDECFPSKECCVCDTTCTYGGISKQLFDVWKDPKTCTRNRCVLPESTIRALGYAGDIDYQDLTNKDMLAVFNDLKTKVDYRLMILKKNVSQKLYEQCQQDISLCPKIYDMGCEPVETCPTCHVTEITQDACGCDVATCTEIPRCEPITNCSLPYIVTKIPDADPCKAPCYQCTCDHACFDDVTGSTYETGDKWDRIIETPRSCESCTCTDDKDDKDGCQLESCEPIPCPAVDECTAPYDKATYREDECGCTHLVSCECTQCMHEGAVLPDKSVGESWREGDVENGCFNTYYCELYKQPGKELECYNVTKERAKCPVDPECPEDHVPVKDEDRSCCLDEICCPRHDCTCVKCRFNGNSYNPGDEWTEDCIDYSCTDTTDEADPAKCKLVLSKPSPCTEEKPICEDCYVEYLATARDVAAGECCNIFGCRPEAVCIKEDNTRVPNGTIWMKDECTRLMCYVSDEDWAIGKCPVPTPRDPCINDLTLPCPQCTNKTIVPDICDCPSVSCEPLNKVVECTKPTAYQVLTTMETEDSCQPSKNCCMCDGNCLYKGAKKELLSVWWDEETCMRMRCVPTESLLNKMGYDASSINFADLEDDDLWREMRSKIDFRKFLSESKIATKLYEQCSQDGSLCPTAMSIGCPTPDPCPNCTNEINTKDSCDCPIRSCVPYVCPPREFDIEECAAPKSKLVEISLNGRSDKYPCCPVGKECICHETCFDFLNNPRAIGEDWEEPSEYTCSDSDPSVTGTIVRKRCNPPVMNATDEKICPYTTIVPCEEPITCKPCEETVTTINERCCPIVTCNKIECEINTVADCVPPKIAMRSDSEVTDDDCCPKYCDCPYLCTETETGETYGRNLVWPHPSNSCYTRTCLVDPVGILNSGCPYIANNSICTEPKECEACFTAIDSVDACGCTERACERNPCSKKTCDDECDEVYEKDIDSCGCPILECRPKPCPEASVVCDDPEKDVYSWMNLEVDKCCKQHGCRCNYTKCVEPKCPLGQIPIRNISAVKCCCPEYICVPDDDSQCTDYNGVPRMVGVPWINKDNQCKMLQCTYSGAKKSSYKIEEFDRFICSSEKPVCANGRASYLASTKEGCCREWVCPCTCQVYGDPHFMTFDGHSYDYQGKCTYTLMKEYAFNQTEVIVDNELCRWQSARRKSLSCLKTMTVLHRSVNYTFTFGLKFLRNGEEFAARKEWVSEDGDVTVREFGYKRLRLYINSIQLEIIYKTRTWEQSLIMTLPYESLEGRMLGLCGSCNNDPDDDFRDRAMKIVEVKNEHDFENIDKFGEGWMKNMKDFDDPKCIPVEPDCPEETEFPDCGELPPDECIDCDNKCHLSHQKCHSCEADPCQVLRTNPVYKEANLRVDPRVYMSKCAYDLSLENNVTNKCNPCFSPSIVQYASINELSGLCVPWRSALGCPDAECPPGQEYRGCDMDAKRDLSCDLLVLNITASVNVEGCFCPEGTVRKTATSEECVPLACCKGCSEPPTCEDGSVALPGANTDDCGCPIYMCSGVEGCQVLESEQSLEITIDGKICRYPENVVSADCAGNCAVSTKSVNGELEKTCSGCKPTSTTTRSVALLCNDGSTENYEYDVISACECVSSSCASTSCVDENETGDVTSTK